MPSNDFELFPSWGNNIELVQDIPDSLKGYRLPASTPWLGRGDFGHLLAYHHAGDHFEFWATNIQIDEAVTLFGRSHLHALEVHMPFVNSFESDWDGAGKIRLPEKQFGMTYTPHVDNASHFKKGYYFTFDVHYTVDYLRSFAAHHPLLQRFIEQIDLGKPASLSVHPLSLTLPMLRLIRSILQYDLREGLAPYYFEYAAGMLLTMILSNLDDTDPMAPMLYTADEVARTYRAKELMEDNLARTFTMKDLADKTGLKISTLQGCFRQWFGTTIYQHGIEIRMLKAQFYLTQYPEHKIRDIAMLVGYQDNSNFTAAFRKFFGYTPEWYRRHFKG